MSRFTRWVAVAAGAVTAVVLSQVLAPSGVGVAEGATTVPPFAVPPAALGSCQVRQLAATLPDQTPVTVSGTLCTPAGSTPGTVQLLVHGATYNSSYWSWPQNPQNQSYVWQALAAGYATFAMDRIGAGNSSAPVSTKVTFDAQASVIHQTIGALRTGTLGSYRKVVLVGHSQGSAESIGEAATWPDADAFVITGSAHKPSQTTVNQLKLIRPANAQLARFAGRDDGYVTTTTVQARRDLMYNTSAPQSTVDYDAANRDVVTMTETTTRPPDLSALTRKITVPVLLIDGGQDSHYCNGVNPGEDTGLDDCSSPAGLYASEKDNFAACFSAAVVPGSGHVLTLHPQAPTAARSMLGWILLTVPVDGSRSSCAVIGPFNH